MLPNGHHLRERRPVENFKGCAIVAGFSGHVVVNCSRDGGSGCPLKGGEVDYAAGKFPFSVFETMAGIRPEGLEGPCGREKRSGNRPDDLCISAARRGDDTEVSRASWRIRLFADPPGTVSCG